MVTDGEFVEADVPVRVSGVTGNQIIVERIATTDKTIKNYIEET